MKVILGAAALLLLAGCSGGSSQPTVDHDALVHGVEKWAVKNEGAGSNVHVSCPDGIPQKAGTKFHCLVRDHGQTLRIVVTVENDQGYLTWVVG